MITTSKAIIVSFSGLSQRSEYTTYTISRGGSVIYTGKTFVDGSGATTMRIDAILRDYVWKWGYTNAMQNKFPSSMVSIGDTLATIESGSTFLNDSFVVSVGSSTKTINVYGGWDAIWQNTIILEDENITNIGYSVSGVAPHIPHVLTDNFWIGCVFNYGDDVPVGDFYFDCGGRQSTPFNITSSGNYAIALTLNDFFLDFDNEITSKICYLTADDGKHDILCEIDECASDYYVSWITPQGGWSSYGFSGNVTMSANNKANTLEDYNGEKRVYSASNEQTFSLYTKYVGADVYAHLLTISASPICYVYDVERDMGWYCIPNTNNMATIPSRSASPQAFNIELQTTENDNA